MTIISKKHVGIRILSIMYIVIGSVLILIFSITYFFDEELIFYNDDSQIHDIPNWITLIVEITIGLSIAIIILIITQFSDIQTKEELKEEFKNQSTAPEQSTFDRSTDRDDTSSQI